jgi:hypothetical protein
MSTNPPTANPEVGRLLLQVRSSANWFFFIAGLSIINSVLFAAGSRFIFVVGLAFMQISDEFGAIVITGTAGHVVSLLIDAVIAGLFVGLGLISRKGTAWSFIVGIAIYTLDALLLLWVTDWLSVAFHALALFFLFQGFRASRQLAAIRAAAQTPPGTVPPITPR